MTHTARNYLSARGIGTGTNHTVSGIAELMESYAKQQAVEFAEWIRQSGYQAQRIKKNWWYNIEKHDSGSKPVLMTTDELYLKWQEENK